MAALTAASWTVSVREQQIGYGKRRVEGTLALPGTDTYPAGGIPLPAFDRFGMVRQLDCLEIYGVNGAAGAVADYMVRHDRANRKLLLFVEEAAAAGGPLLAADAAEVPGPRTYDFVAYGW